VLLEKKTRHQQGKEPARKWKCYVWRCATTPI
jgi:hypothetical protein